MAFDVNALTPAQLAAAVAESSSRKVRARRDKDRCRVSPVTGLCSKCGHPGGQDKCQHNAGLSFAMPLMRRVDWNH